MLEVLRNLLDLGLDILIGFYLKVLLKCPRFIQSIVPVKIFVLGTMQTPLKGPLVFQPAQTISGERLTKFRWCLEDLIRDYETRWQEKAFVERREVLEEDWSCLRIWGATVGFAMYVKGALKEDIPILEGLQIPSPEESF